MTHNFNPGDVAQVAWTNAGGRSGGNGVCVRFDEEGVGYWRHGTSGWTVFDEQVTDARPLVVIDPEDREQAIRLTELFYAAGVDGDAHHYGRMQAALREFASPNPPRIDEPGTWGVVEASCVHDGIRCEWVKFPSGNWHTVHERAGDLRNPDDWDSLIDPVLVREGVSDA